MTIPPEVFAGRQGNFAQEAGFAKYGLFSDSGRSSRVRRKSGENTELQMLRFRINVGLSWIPLS